MTVQIGPITFEGVVPDAAVILERGRRHYHPQGQTWLLMQALAGRVNDGNATLGDASALADQIESGAVTALPPLAN